MAKRLLSFVIFTLWGVAIADPAPISFKINHDKSAITFTATQNNAPIEGTFKSFDGEILFHPEALDKSHAKITIELDSVSTTYHEVMAELKKPDWFNISIFPKAVFETKSFVHVEDKQYQAIGTLTMKGKTIPVTLDFTLEGFAKTAAHITGSASLQRTDFGIGWSDTSAIKDEITVTVKVEASS